METLWNTGMKQFDPLIIPGKKPMTVFDTEEASLQVMHVTLLW